MGEESREGADGWKAMELENLLFAAREEEQDSAWDLAGDPRSINGVTQNDIMGCSPP
jgi:hypothetical protein